MSTRSGQSEVHRILGRDEEAYETHAWVVTASRVVPDAAFLDHVGAHFPPGSRNGSLPVYPERVEIIEDEAVSGQPNITTPGEVSPYQVQNARSRGPLHHSTTTPTRHMLRDYLSMSQRDFMHFQRQSSGEHRNGHGSVYSNETKESAPPQSHQDGASSISSHSEDKRPAVSVVRHTYATSRGDLLDFSQSHTPSRCSEVTDEGDTYMEGSGPSPPHPFSEWDRYRSEYHFGSDQTYSNRLRGGNNAQRQ